MKAVTCSAQLGSRGAEIAGGAAQALGWRLVQRELINQAAIRAGAPEIALAEIDEFGLFHLHLRSQVRRTFVREIQALARELVSQGGVLLVGPSAHAMVGETPGVLHVRIIAPHEQRLAWLVEKEGISTQAAAARLMVSDQARARSLQRDYGTDWRNWEAYHLILNSARLGVPAAIGLIVQAVQGV